MVKSYLFPLLSFCLHPVILKASRVLLMGEKVGEKSFSQRLPRKNLLSIVGNCKDNKGMFLNFCGSWAQERFRKLSRSGRLKTVEVSLLN